MPDAAFPTLDLPPPDALPAELRPDAAGAARLRRDLAAFLAALAEEDAGRRSERLCALTHVAGVAAAAPAEDAEIAEFDAYFDVRRVSGAVDAAVLLAGLAQTAAAATLLSLRAPHLNHEELARQRAGFAAQARLLGRLCGLEAPA